MQARRTESPRLRLRGRTRLARQRRFWYASRPARERGCPCPAELPDRPLRTHFMLVDFFRPWLIVIAATWSLACGCAAWRRLPEAKIIAGRRLALEGMDLEDRGDWDAAEDRFAAALRLNPRDERTHWRYGESLWRRGDIQGAARHLEQSIRLSADDPQLMVRLGRLRIEQGELADAERIAEQAVLVAPQDPAAHQLLGDTLMEQLRPDEALAAYHRALDLGGEDARLAVARIYHQQRQPRRVLATLQPLETDQVLEVWKLRAWAFTQLSLPEEALAANRRAAEIALQRPADPNRVVSRQQR